MGGNPSLTYLVFVMVFCRSFNMSGVPKKTGENRAGKLAAVQEIKNRAKTGELDLSYRNHGPDGAIATSDSWTAYCLREPFSTLMLLKFTSVRTLQVFKLGVRRGYLGFLKLWTNFSL